MHWGSLLLWGWEDLKEAFTGGIANLIYSLRQLFVSILYNIWRLLAWIVSGIESIFRGLAGLDTTDDDMVSKIINDDNVQQIFGNLVGFSMALIIFFTIVKIIQEHYKEKDGGNPYKIVIRTFKGLLMFFFVHAAVVVGLYASRVMFRALDSATSAGSTTLAGQVFKAMAADANRKRIGRQGDDDGWIATAMNKYWSRVADPQYVANDGKYMIVQVKRNVSSASKPKSFREQYLEAFPSMRYGVVGRDGKTVTPLATWLGTMADSDDDDDDDKSFKDQIKDSIKDNGWNVHDGWDYWGAGGEMDGWDTDFWETGSSSASVGYQNDLLKGVSLSVKPHISLTWSPIDIWTYGNQLVEVRELEFDQNPTILGTGILIKMSLQFVAFGDKPVISPKSLEESAKVFGISINAGVALQDGKASADFKLEMFDPSKFGEILKTVLINVVYTNLAQKILEFIPALPAALNVGPLSVDFLGMFAPLLIDMMKTCVDNVMGKLLPVDKETGKPTVEAFSTEASQTSSGTWLVINPKSQFLTTTIEQYKLDGNFTDLWSQLMDNFDELVKQMEESNKQSWDGAKGYQEMIKQMGGNIQGQGNWQAWKAGVDQYNSTAASAINQLAQYLNLYNGAKTHGGASAESRDQWLAEAMTGSRLLTFAQLESNIKNIFTNVVDEYNKMFGAGAYTGYPTDSYADPTITPAIYKPIVEFHFTKNVAASMSTDQILEVFSSGEANGNKMKVNMIIDNASGRRYNSDLTAAYRIVDWNRYGKTYNTEKIGGGMKGVADLHYEGSTPDGAVSSSSFNKLAFMTFNNANAAGGDWDDKDLSFFASFANSPFAMMSTDRGDVWIDYGFEENAYWGTNGIVAPNIKDKPIYYYYVGTTLTEKNITPLGKAEAAIQNFKDKTTGKKPWKEEDEKKSGTASAGTMRLSTANMNTAAAANQQSISSEISTFADVDTTTPLATEFSNHILTFRELYPAGDGDTDDPDDPNASKGDKKVLDEWCSAESNVGLTGDGEVEALYNWDANKIDNYMAGTSTGNRRYLLLSQKNTIEPDRSKLGTYVGAFTFTDTSTVNALYDYYWMNYAVGFIAIITATGVYLNFALGLIQRAVNMAVLYIMSPITIAFYPFDDGQRFNQHFVSAFYKEAISAYAVIVSLNIFILLMTPVKDAVASVNKTLSWLALVAMVSMLPKLRDQITSILGANSMQGKSFAAAIGESKKQMLDPYLENVNGMRKVGAFAAHRIDSIRRTVDGKRAKSQANKQAEIDKLEKLRQEGKLSSWGEKRLNKLSKSARESSQARINDALKSGNTDGLSNREMKRYNRLQNAAKKQAELDVKKEKGESKKDYEARVAARQNELLTGAGSEAFKKSVNGVISSTKFGRGVKGAAGALNAKLSDFSKSYAAYNKELYGDGTTDSGAELIGRVGRSISQRASHLGTSLKNSFVGEWASQKFGVNGEWVQNKDSLGGSIARMFNAQVRKDEMKKITNKELAYQRAKNEYKDAIPAGYGVDALNNAEADTIIHDGVKQSVALDAVKKSGKNSRDKLEDLLVAENVKSGKNREDAKKAAAATMAQMKKDGKSFGTEYIKRGGDAVYAAGLADGLEEFKGLSIDPDFDAMKEEMAAAEKALRSHGSAKNIQAKIDTAKANRKTKVDDYAAQIANQLKKGDDPDAKKRIAKILGDANITTSYDDIVGNMSKQLGIERGEVDQVISANYHNYASEIQYNNEIQNLQTALSAQKLRDKGAELFRTKIGDGVPKEVADDLLHHFRNVNDANLNSTNPESLGYLTNQIIEEYKDTGKLNNPECQARVQQLSSRMKAELNAHTESFEAQYGNAIREHSIAQKFKQDMQSLPTMATMTEKQNQRERIFSLDLDAQATTWLANDSHIQNMHLDGNYSGSGLEIQQLIDHALRHEWVSAEQLNFDKASVQQLRTWVESGDPAVIKRLEGLRKLAVWDSANMGNMITEMGGTSIASQETGLALITSIAELQQISKKLTIARDNAAHQESNARAFVQSEINTIPSAFNGKDWEAIYGKISFPNGQPVKNADEFKAALIATVKAVDDQTYKTSDATIKKNIDALSEYMSIMAQQNRTDIVNTVTDFNRAIGNAELGNEKAAELFKTNNLISDLQGRSRDIMQKLNKDSGGK